MHINEDGAHSHLKASHVGVSSVSTVKFALFCLVVGCAFHFSAEGLSRPPSQNIGFQRLIRFSGVLTEASRKGTIGAVNLRFTIYAEASGGQVYWQGTQEVHPNPQGRYTVLLGEVTPGGLPASIFASRRTLWLEIKSSGDRHPPRIPLVDLPSSLGPDALGPDTSITRRGTPDSGSDRYLMLVLLLMFVTGTVMAYGELLRWWKIRTERFGEPPFANLIASLPKPERLRQGAQQFRTALPVKFGSIRRRFQASIQRINRDQPKKAA